MFDKLIEKNNISFYIEKTDRFKMSRLSLNFIMPADAEKTPLTKLMLAVMMRGSKKYPSINLINKRLDELYGATVTWRVTPIGERHVFRISCDMLGNRYRLHGDDSDIAAGVAALVLDILFDPLKDEQGMLDGFNIASEKKIAIDSIKAKINDQKAYAADQCRKIMLGDHISGISTYGTPEMIEGFTARQLTENIERFLRESVIECYYVGNDDADKLVSMISESFASLGRKTNRIFGSETAFMPVEMTLKEKNETMEVSQGRLQIGCRCGTVMSDEKYYAMNLFNEIFGGSSVGKLFMNLREKKSLCYYCYSSYHSANGTIMIGCGIKKENKDKAIKEIYAQLKAMQRGDFDYDEINIAKQTIISGLRQVYDNPSAIEAYCFRRLLADVHESVDESIDKIFAVTKDQIIAAARLVELDTVYFLSGSGEEELDCE